MLIECVNIPFFVQLLHHFRIGPKPFFVMELMQGSLMDSGLGPMHAPR